MSDDRVATAPCGCGIFQRGPDTIKVHDGKCEFATKKPAKETVKPIEYGTTKSGMSAKAKK